MLGAILRQARLEANLTQEELSFRCGLTRNYISLLELDAKSPTVTSLLLICDGLGIKPSVLFQALEGTSAYRRRSRPRGVGRGGSRR